MNSRHKFLAMIYGFCVLVAWAYAAGASPAGNWKWTAISHSGPHESTAKFELRGDKLVGTVDTVRGKFAIKEASFNDGAIAFTVDVPIGQETVVNKFRGRLEGDSIKGTIDRSGRDGGPPIRVDWYASRVK